MSLLWVPHCAVCPSEAKSWWTSPVITIIFIISRSTTTFSFARFNGSSDNFTSTGTDPSDDYFTLQIIPAMDSDWQPWIGSVLGSMLVGLSGVFPLILIPDSAKMKSTDIPLGMF